MRENEGELLSLRKSELERVVNRMPFGLLQVLIGVAEFFNLVERLVKLSGGAGDEILQWRGERDLICHS